MAGSQLYISNLLSDMLTKLDGVKADNSDVVAAVNSMGTKLETMGNKLDDLATKLTTVDTSVKAVTTKLATVDSSVKAVVTKTNEVKTVLGYGEV